MPSDTVERTLSEGNQGKLKKAFAPYTWINPKYSQLYLNEYTFFCNAKYYDVGKLAETMNNPIPSQDLFLDRNGTLRGLDIEMYSRSSLYSQRKYPFRPHTPP
jgi:hypothetical protein